MVITGPTNFAAAPLLQTGSGESLGHFLCHHLYRYLRCKVLLTASTTINCDYGFLIWPELSHVSQAPDPWGPHGPCSRLRGWSAPFCGLQH